MQCHIWLKQVRKWRRISFGWYVVNSCKESAQNQQYSTAKNVHVAELAMKLKHSLVLRPFSDRRLGYLSWLIPAYSTAAEDIWDGMHFVHNTWSVEVTVVTCFLCHAQWFVHPITKPSQPFPVVTYFCSQAGLPIFLHSPRDKIWVGPGNEASYLPVFMLCAFSS